MHVGYGNTVYVSLTSLAFKIPFKNNDIQKWVSVHRVVRNK